MILKLPYGDSNYEKKEIGVDINCWQLYYNDLFEKSLYINPSSVITSDIEFLWDCTKKDSIRLVNNIKNIREKNINIYGPDFHLKNEMDVVFGEMMYFDKTKKVDIFFELLDVISKNWEFFSSKYVKENRPNVFNFGICLSIISKILGKKYYHNDTWFSYTSMEKSTMMKEPDAWLNRDFSLHINNHCQHGVLFYNNSSIREIYNDRITKEKNK